MRGDPHKLVEGCLVAGRAMNATAGECGADVVTSSNLDLSSSWLSPDWGSPGCSEVSSCLNAPADTANPSAQHTSTSEASSTRRRTISRSPSTKPTRRVSSARTPVDPATTLTYMSTAGPELTFAERRPHLSSRWKASRESHVSSHPSPPTSVSLAALPPSPTWRPSRSPRPSFDEVPRGSTLSAESATAARRCSASPATSTSRVSSRRRCPSACASSSRSTAAVFEAAGTTFSVSFQAVPRCRSSTSRSARRPCECALWPRSSLSRKDRC